MATTRLRKTFKYPSDDEGSDVSHDEMDEEGESSPDPTHEGVLRRPTTVPVMSNNAAH